MNHQIMRSQVAPAPNVESGARAPFPKLRRIQYGISQHHGDCSRVTGKPEVIASSVALVPRNALVSTNIGGLRLLGYSEVTWIFG
jgi:hypothetical protein